MLDLAHIQTFLRQQIPHLLAIYLFGSHAKGHADHNSDIDIAVLVDSKIDKLTLWELSAKMAQKLGSNVDLVDLRTSSTVMQAQIILQGQCLWQKDGQGDWYACFILREKLELDLRRSAQIKDIQDRGNIYD